MKRYYSETIPVELGLKLQDAGMPDIDLDEDTWNAGTEYEKTERWCNTTYAEVLDWFSEKGYDVAIRRNLLKPYKWWSDVFHTIDENSDETVQVRKDGVWLYTLDWFEAANAGIETALKMLKERERNEDR